MGTDFPLQEKTATLSYVCLPPTQWSNSPLSPSLCRIERQSFIIEKLYRTSNVVSIGILFSPAKLSPYRRMSALRKLVRISDMNTKYLARPHTHTQQLVLLLLPLSMSACSNEFRFYAVAIATYRMQLFLIGHRHNTYNCAPEHIASTQPYSSLLRTPCTNRTCIAGITSEPVPASTKPIT